MANFKYIVIGRLENGENTRMIFEAKSAKEAERKFQHDMEEEREDDFDDREVYIDFIFRIPGSTDVFVCQDDWGWHEEEDEMPQGTGTGGKDDWGSIGEPS